MIIFLICINNISSFQLDLARRKSKSKKSKSKSKTLTKEVDFTIRENLLNMLGGFVSYFFGFYQEYKTAQGVFSCITDAYPTIESTFKSAFTQITSKLTNTIDKCKTSNPVQLVWDAGADLFRAAGKAIASAVGQQQKDEVDRIADELYAKQGECYLSAKDLLASISAVITSIKELVISVRKCIEDFSANKSKPSYLSELVINTAKSLATTVTSWATGGISDFVPAILIAIKFILVCASSDAQFLPIHKYRVLGKYLAQIVKLFLKISRRIRRVKYNYYKKKMMKYKK
jgi:hypothetical protein